MTNTLFFYGDLNLELEKETFGLFDLTPKVFCFDTNLRWFVYYSGDYYIIKNRQIAEKLKEEFPKLRESNDEIIKNGR
jgi:hypothetical protein